MVQYIPWIEDSSFFMTSAHKIQWIVEIFMIVCVKYYIGNNVGDKMNQLINILQ